MKNGDIPLKTRAMSFKHPLLTKFESVPTGAISFLLKLLAVLLPYGICWGVASAISFLWPEVSSTFLLLAIVIVGFGGGVFVTYRLALGRMVRLELIDAKALNEVDDPDRYVGLSYLESISVSRKDSSWDRGWLSFVEDHLCFHGYVSSFKLPIEFIRSIQVAQSRSLMTLSIPRVVIEWQHPEGTLETMILEARVGMSKKALTEMTHRIAHWLNLYCGGSTEGKSPKSDVDLLPMRSSEIHCDANP
jgi:hypothetical protein